MNKILSLFDKDFVNSYFYEHILPLYPQVKQISDISIKPYKKLVWETTYHVVIGFSIKAIADSGRRLEIPVVCSAHSSEPRELAYKVLKYLWKRNFATREFAIPRPLFFDRNFNATFYRAVKGDDLFHFIKDNNRPIIMELMHRSARLFGHLHDFPVTKNFEYNASNAMIETVIPGKDNVIKEVNERFGLELASRISRLYDRFISQEKNNWSRIGFSIIHGDAHTENIIKVKNSRIGLIDFTDFSVSDRFRDVGSFLQQLEYKIVSKIGDVAFAKECKQEFLRAYLDYCHLSLDDDIQSRINLYYAWTSVRTVTFWLLKYDPAPDRAMEMLDNLEPLVDDINFRAQD
jgi:aminoglycoside phosphotransferase